MKPRRRRRGAVPLLPQEVGPMTEERTPHTRLRDWHVGEKATIDHLVSTLAPEPVRVETRIHEAVTASGLSVEAQVRKMWNSPFIGLAVF
jgi:hypothetical protein